MLDGETVILAPVPADGPPHEPVNHSHTAPVPNEPPETVRVVDVPEHTVLVPVMLVGAVDNVFTVTAAVAHAVLEQPVPVPGSYLTK